MSEEEKADQEDQILHFLQLGQASEEMIMKPQEQDEIEALIGSLDLP